MSVQWIDFKKIFNWSYLTDGALSLKGPLVAFLGYIFLLVIIAGIILTIIFNRKNKKMPIYSVIVGHINNLSLWLGITGIILVLSRFEGIYILSNRLLLLLVILGMLFWIGWIIYYAVAKLPKMRSEYIKNKEKSKYLPKKKVKKIML